MIKYVKSEVAKVYESSSSSRSFMELLWGDRVEITNQRSSNGRFQVNARGRRGIFVRSKDLGDEPLLEFYFIDVGQGDGILIVTPERKHILIDGGYKRSKQPHGKSAADFVDWKFFKDYRTDTIELDAMIASHCDADHYGGLHDLLLSRDNKELDTKQTNIKNFYHAGVSWWKSDDKSRFLGREQDGQLIDLLTGKTSVRKGLRSSSDLRLQGEWADFLKDILKTNAGIQRIGYNPGKNFEYLPGFDEDENVKIKILGPIESEHNGRPSVKDLGSYSTNTNGNSILLRIDYKRSRILLTGDLNKKSQQYIVESLKGNILELAADVTKACHHGSDDCSYDFLQKVNAAATIISSGDDETHAHPRPNIIAASGLTGFQEIEKDELITPLVFSTEVSRSLRLGDPQSITYKTSSGSDDDGKIELKDEKEITVNYTRTKSGALRPESKTSTLNRLKVVDGIVYGLVNVRTDGNKIVCATLNEGKAKWDIKSFYSRF